MIYYKVRALQSSTSMNESQVQILPFSVYISRFEDYIRDIASWLQWVMRFLGLGETGVGLLGLIN